MASRYRCGTCGNLTRFDVTSTRRTRAFHHFNLAGDLTVEDEEVLDEVVEEVLCRWCGTGGAIEMMADGTRKRSAAEGAGAAAEGVGAAAEGAAEAQT